MHSVPLAPAPSAAPWPPGQPRDARGRSGAADVTHTAGPAAPSLASSRATAPKATSARHAVCAYSVLSPRPMSTPRLPAAKPQTPSTKGRGAVLSPDTLTSTPRGPARQMPGEPSSDKRRESGPDAAAKLLERDFPQGGISFHFRPNELQFLSRHLPPMSSKLDKSHLAFPKSILLHSAPHDWLCSAGCSMRAQHGSCLHRRGPTPGTAHAVESGCRCPSLRPQGRMDATLRRAVTGLRAGGPRLMDDRGSGSDCLRLELGIPGGANLR